MEDVDGGPLSDFKIAYPGNVRVYPSPNLDYGWTQEGLAWLPPAALILRF